METFIDALAAVVSAAFFVVATVYALAGLAHLLRKMLRKISAAMRGGE